MQVQQNVKAGRRAMTAAKDPSATAFNFLLAYFFIEYVRPQDRIPGVSALKIGFIVTIICAVYWIAKGDKSVLKDALIRWYIAFIAVAAISITFAVNTFWVYQCTRAVTLMLLAATLPSAGLLADPERMRKFAGAWVLFHALLALGSLRTKGMGPGAFLGDENDLALAFNMAVPYAYFMSVSPKTSPRNRWWFRLGTIIIVVGSVFTWSRGGFLGLIAAMGMIWLMSPNKIKNALIIATIGLIAIVGISTLTGKGSVLAEFSTIDDPNDSTRRDRIDSWGTGWVMFLDNPVLGVGAGNYAWRVGEYQLKDPNFDPRHRTSRSGRAAHSLYFTLIPEMGLAGIVIYVAMITLIIKRCREVLKMRPKAGADPDALREFQLLAKAMIAALMGYLISGAFISVLWYPHFFYLAGFAVALAYGGRKLGEIPGPQAARRARRG